MKKSIRSISAFLVLSLLLLCLCCCSQRPSSPLMWKVSNTDDEILLYLFGSIHACDYSMYPLPADVENAFDMCDVLAVECDTTKSEYDPEISEFLLSKMLLPDGTTAEQALGAELYEKTVKIMKRNGFYSAEYEYCNPVYWWILIEQLVMMRAGLSSELGIDNYFMSSAQKNEMNIIEIESMKSQYDLLFSIPDELALFYIENYAENFSGNILGLKMLYKAYRSGNIDMLESLLLSETDYSQLGYTDEQAAFYKNLESEFNKKMSEDRNIWMAEYADRCIKSGDLVFFVVGEAHMLGEGGVVDRLSKMGYSVELVSGK